jgi:hypothetical protein
VPSAQGDRGFRSAERDHAAAVGCEPPAIRPHVTRIQADGHHARRALPRGRHDLRVRRRHDGQRRSDEDLALLGEDTGQIAKALEMLLAKRRHHRHVRLGDRAQGRQLPPRIRPDLDDRDVRPIRERQERQRNPDLVVAVRRCRVHLEHAAEGGAQELFRRRLPVRPRHGDHRLARATPGTAAIPAKGTQRRPRVWHDVERHAGIAGTPNVRDHQGARAAIQGVA